MTKHAADTASTTKKFLAAGGLAFGLASLGLFAGPVTNEADGHSINDPNATWPCDVGPCSSSGGAEGAQDVGEQRGEDDVPADNEGQMVSSVEPIDTSTDSPHNNTWPENNLPAASYPAAPSWPGGGWGVNDRAST